MRYLFLLFMTSWTLGKSFAQEKPFSAGLSDKKYYYSALHEFFLESHKKVIIKDDLKKLEDLLYFTGIELLEDYELELLNKYPTSSTRFIIGRSLLSKKKYRAAVEHFSLIHPEHRYYPEGKLLEAQAYDQQSLTKERDRAYGECQSSAQEQEAEGQTEKIKRYYRMLQEICLVNKGRHEFKSGSYKEALETYGKIPKKSYKWPYLLLEKAWVHFQLKDFNRTLGLLTTYKSPLLSTYFFPEAEYLAALSYFNLCLYEDSLTIINQFYQVYRPRFIALEKVLKANRGSKDYFYRLLLNEAGDFGAEGDFIRQIVSRMKKQIRFSLDFNALHRLDQEISRIDQNEKKVIKDRLLPHLRMVRENIISKINYNAKKDIFDFLDTIPFLSQELYKLNLEIIAKKKDLVYTNRKLVSDRSRGDYSNVNRSRFEYFWKFEGAFWADELGDYSLGLKSNCQTERNEVKEGG